MLNKTIFLTLILTLVFAIPANAKKYTYKVTVTNGCSKTVTVRLLRNKTNYFIGYCTKKTLSAGETKTLTCTWRTNKDKGVILAPINRKVCFETEVRKVKTTLFGKKKNANVCKVYKGTSTKVTIPAEIGCTLLRK